MRGGLPDDSSARLPGPLVARRALIFAVIASLVLDLSVGISPPPVRAVVPVANFTAGPTLGPAPLVVAFHDASQNAASWLWEFGDGDISTEQNPIHHYLTPGRHTVRLTVHSEDGSSDTRQIDNLVVVDRLLSLDRVPQPDAAFGSVVTNGPKITDDDINSKGDVSPAPPNNGFWYDLGAAYWISRAKVKAMHSSSSYSSRIAIWATNTDPSGGSPGWTKIYDTNVNTPEGGLREFTIDSANGGPWRYIRFQMVSQQINSSSKRWFTAEAWGTEATTIEHALTARFSADTAGGIDPPYSMPANLVRFPEGDAPTRETLVEATSSVDGLVSHWSLDEIDAALAADSRGPNDLTIGSGVARARSGVALGSYAFSFSNAILQDSTPVNLPLGASPRTVAFWYRGTSTAKQTVVSYGTNATRQSFSVAINEGGAGRVGVWTYANDGSAYVPEIIDGRWHHVAATYDGNVTVRIYVDGEQRGTLTLAAALNTVVSANGLIIGRDHFQSANWLVSTIDEAAIFNRALSASELLGITNAGSAARYRAIEIYNPAFLASYAADGIATNSSADRMSWAATGHSTGDWWRVDWAAAQQLDTVRIWDRTGTADYFGNGKVVFSDGSEVTFTGLPNDPGTTGAAYKDVTFPEKSGITWLRVETTGAHAGNLGLAEVAAFRSTSPVNDGLRVQLTDTSTGSPVAWYWNFGDGTASNDQHPVHHYTASGGYTVSLRVTDAEGTSDTTTFVNFIVVEQLATSGLPVGMNGVQFCNDTSCSQVTDGAEIIDASSSTFDYWTGCCPNSLYLDLGAPKAVSMVQVMTAYSNSSGYAARIAIYGSNDALTWTKLHDDYGNVTEKQVREIRMAADEHGPWRYVRFEQVSRSIGSGTHRMYMARVFAANPVAPTGDSTPPVADFSAPDEGTVVSQAQTSFTAAWTETDPPSGGDASGVAARSIQLQRASAALGACPASQYAWSDVGDPVTEASPQSFSGLEHGYCYRFAATLTDNEDNAATSTSGSVIADLDGPTVTAAVDTANSIGWTYRAGDVVFFDASAAGSVDVSADGFDLETGIDGHTFTASHDPAQSGYFSGDPATRTIAWEADESTFTLSLMARNRANLDSAALVLTFIPDLEGPQVAFDTPPEATSARTEVPAVDISWQELDNEGLIASRSLQRQRAPGDGLVDCASATWTDDGPPVSTPSPITQTVAPRHCYRWHITITDQADRTAEATSGIIFVAERSGPIGAFLNPASDLDVFAALDFEDTDALAGAGWPGTRTTDQGTGNRYMALGGITVSYPGPKFPTAPGEVFRMTLRAQPAGPHAWFGICFYRADNSEISCPSAAKILADATMASLTTRVATAPGATAQVGIRFYHVYGTSTYDDLVFERVLTNGDSQQTETSIEVAWDETVAPQGLPIATRSLQRQKASASTVFGCAAGAWADDGSPVAQVSPVTVGGLVENTCYRWRLTLTDTAGNAATWTSGTIFVVHQTLRVRIAPSAGVGSEAFVSAVLVDVDGEPISGYAGTLTLTTSDPAAVFPEASSATLLASTGGSGHTFRVLFGTAGPQTVTVTGTNAVAGGASLSVTPSSLSASAPATVYQGQPFVLQVSPGAVSGRTAFDYAARVSFASSDTTANFGQETSGTPPAYTFTCGCDDGHGFVVRLSTLGSQTITATDQFAASAQVTVNVVAAPPMGGVPDPIDRIDAVQWRHGSKVDYYVKPHSWAPALTIIEDYHTGPGCRRAGETLGIAVAAGDPTEFTSSIAGGGSCYYFNYYEVGGHHLIYTDNLGHFWVRSVTARWRRFDVVPNNSVFTMLDAGDPISSMEVVSRGGSPTSYGYGRQNGGKAGPVPYIPGGLALRFVTHEPTVIYSVEYAAYGQDRVSPPQQWWPVWTGNTTVAIDDIPYGCYIAGLEPSLAGGRLDYMGPDGRTGALVHVYQFGSSTAAKLPRSTWCPSGRGNIPANHRLAENAPFSLNPADMPVFGDFMRWLEADPVDPFSGGLAYNMTDFDLGGLSPGLSLTRTYRSDQAERVAQGAIEPDTLFGPGWASSWDWSLTDLEGDGSVLRLRAADGGVLDYQRAADQTYTAAGGARLHLEEIVGGWTLSEPSGAGIRFDTVGRLAAIFDPAGRELIVARDASGVPQSVTDAAGRTAEITTDAAGRATQVDLPDGRYVAFTYDAAGRLATQRSVSGQVLNLTYDTRHRLTEIRDSTDVLLANEYDAQGRVITQTDAVGEATWFTYNGRRRVSRIIDPRGAVTTDCYAVRGAQTGRVDALGGIRAWTYDSLGLPASATNELGAMTRFRYGPDARPLAVTDPLGRTVTTAYDSEGRVDTITGLGGQTTEVTYDPVTDLPGTVIRSDGTNSLQVASITYSAAALPATIATPGGASTAIVYDTRGYPTSITDAEQRETTYEVDDRGFVTAVTAPLGNVAGGVPEDFTRHATYDDGGRMLTSTNALDQTTSYDYDSFGRLTSMTTPLGFVTEFDYDLAGRLTERRVQVDATQWAVTTFEYDEAGNLTAVVDGEARRTEFGYDLLGRRTQVIDADEQTWTTEYDAAGRVVATVDPTGRRMEYAYDAAGRQTAVTDTADEVTTYAYDTLDELISVTDPLDHATTFGYDWLGRRTTINDALDQVTTLAYNDAGDLVSLTDAADHTTSFDYNAVHQLTQVTDAVLGETELTYDDGGRLTGVEDPRNNAETTAYDALDRPIELTDPLGNSWTTAYDADGRVDHLIDANGQQTDFAYDRAGRLLTLTPDTGPGISFTYDLTGRRMTMTDGAGATSYTYDPIGRLASAERGGRTVGYTYDPAGRPLTVAYPAGGGTVGYAYDTAGRLQTITDWDSRATTFAYDAASRVTSLTRPGGLTTSYTYDDLNRVTGIDHVRSGSNLLELTYGYDAAGNVASLTDDAGTATFTYDDLNRLTAADYPGTEDYAYVYDPAGNITTLTTPAGSQTLAYDAANRLTSGGRTYDDNGALLDDGATTYTYDALGRLTAVDDGTTPVSYTLDGDGSRLSETVVAQTTTFDLDVRGLATVLGADGRHYLPGVPELGFEEAGQWWNGLTNDQGSVLQLVDTAGVTSPMTRYDPYGGARPSSAPLEVGIGFTGEWLDPAGLLNLRARAYDPGLGRFLTRDSLAGLPGAPQTLNRYAYGLGNPLTFTDPSGHFVNEFLAHPGLYLSLGLQSISGPGDVYSLFTGVIGFDLLAGYALSEAERAIAIASALVVGGGFYLLSRHADEVAGVNRVSTVSDATRFGNQSDAALRPASATRTGERLAGQTTRAAPGRADEAFHFTYSRRLESIQSAGLRPGTYATPVGNLSPLQAQLELSLPPNRGLPDALVRIDVGALRLAGYEIPAVTRVSNVVRDTWGRIYSMPGGGWEMQFPYAIPPEFISVVR